MSGLLTSGQHISGYRVVDYIGGGSLGSVYRAVRIDTGRVVALKVLGDTSCPDRAGELSHWMREATDRLKQVVHPAIPRLLEVIEAGRCPCLVMEYVEGERLSDCLARRGPLPPPEAREIFLQVVDAVAYLHEQGVQHAVSAPNVKVDRRGNVALLDVGIGRWARLGPGQIPERTGRAEYQSPEEIRGREPDERSDVWSLGVLLYEVLTGDLPISGQTTAEIHAAIEGRTMASALRSVSGSSGGDAILQRCLALEPERRFRTARELEQALQDWSPRAGSRSLLDRFSGWREQGLGIKLMALAVILLPILILWNGETVLWSADRESSGSSPVSDLRRVSLRITSSSPVTVSRRDPGSATEIPMGVVEGGRVTFQAHAGQTVEVVLRRSGMDPVIRSVRVHADPTENQVEWTLESE